MIEQVYTSLIHVSQDWPGGWAVIWNYGKDEGAQRNIKVLAAARCGASSERRDCALVFLQHFALDQTDRHTLICN